VTGLADKEGFQMLPEQENVASPYVLSSEALDLNDASLNFLAGTCQNDAPESNHGLSGLTPPLPFLLCRFRYCPYCDRDFNSEAWIFLPSTNLICPQGRHAD
jgi:hypothetical protein